MIIDEKYAPELLKKDNRDFKLALTSGCFDLVHSGHIYFFKEMQRLTSGAKQLVVIHGDDAVRSKKGALRPIMSETERATLLDNIKGIDYVVIWHGWEDVVDIVKDIQPDYLAASDSNINRESWKNSWKSVADEIGAELISVPEIDPDTSTTKLLERIQKLNGTD